MKSFKIKLGLGLAVLFMAFFLSQIIYKKNIAHLHDYTFESLALSEEMHNSEVFHSSMHSMVLAAQSDLERKALSYGKQYLIHKKDAESALQKLKQYNSTGVGSAGHSGPGHHSTAEVLDNLTRGFSSFRKTLDSIYLRRDAAPERHIEKAKKIFDEVFHHYYLKLHEHHDRQIAGMRQATLHIKETTDSYFIGQLIFALLAGMLSLFYIDRVVIKLHSITEHYSLTDSLTSLNNRRYLDRHLQEEFDRATRYGRPFSVAMADIDDFKKYNDSYGHQAGDILLKDLARIMRKLARKTDMVIRYGGEEFLVVLPETDTQAARAFAEKIRAAIESYKFVLPDGTRSSKVTVSIGIAAFPEDGATVSDIISKADALLYDAKNRGKNRVAFREGS